MPSRLLASPLDQALRGEAPAQPLKHGRAPQEDVTRIPTRAKCAFANVPILSIFLLRQRAVRDEFLIQALFGFEYQPEMACHSWIDEALSRELPVLRDRGEGQHLEFIDRYPTNGHELSKEIAAFASSNPGTILLGVADNGSIVGLEDVDTPEGRDRLCRRIEGVCSGNVRPAVTPVVKFATEDGAVVLAIEVPRGTQPIYYNRHTPYIRHLSRSRPAEPHEVTERIAEWLRSNAFVPEEDDSDFLSSLATALIDVLIYGSEFDQRNLNPWFDLARTQLDNAGSNLRSLAADDIAVQRGLNKQLRSIADKLDSATNYVLAIGRDSWNVLTGYVAEAVAEAARLKTEYIDRAPIPDRAKKNIADTIRRWARELADLDSRAETITADGRIEELQQAASRIGYSLLQISYYQPSLPGSVFNADLQSIGRELHLLETKRLYMDGGQSVRRIVQHVHDLNGRLQWWLSKYLAR